MKKREAQKEIETLRARLEVLEKIVQDPEVERLWRPTMGEDYWFFGGWDAAFISTFANDIYDQPRIALGLCFPTKEAAEKAFQLFAIAHKVIQAALQVDPDAGRFIQGARSWSAFYDVSEKKWVADIWALVDATPVYVHTEEQAERMAAILNAEGV